MPKKFPPEFKRDVATVARRGDPTVAKPRTVRDRFLHSPGSRGRRWPVLITFRRPGVKGTPWRFAESASWRAASSFAERPNSNKDATRPGRLGPGSSQGPPLTRRTGPDQAFMNPVPPIQDVSRVSDQR